jgi:hypothetical protein
MIGETLDGQMFHTTDSINSKFYGFTKGLLNEQAVIRNRESGRRGEELQTSTVSAQTTDREDQSTSDIPKV